MSKAKAIIGVGMMTGALVVGGVLLSKSSTSLPSTPVTPINPVNKRVNVEAKASQLPCDPTLWRHVYVGRFKKPQNRLKVVQDCVTVTGTFVHAKAEPDGDSHITIKLDSQYTSMLNGFNRSRQHGYLVIELMCANPVSQADARKEGVCNNFHQSFKLPKKGARVSVTGSYVIDVEHGWSEIHPVTAI